MAKTKLNRAGVKAMLNAPDVAAMLAAEAAQVLARAQAGAPVRTGEYRGSLRAWVDRTDRAVARVGSDVDHALAVEAATGNLVRALGDGQVDPGSVRVKYRTKAGKTRWATQAQVDNWTRGSR